jgi:hypothetical protein
MLQALEHMLDEVDRLSVVAGQLVNAQRSGKPLADSVLTRYEAELKQLEQQRARMRDIVVRFWTLVESAQ